jgi:hypothetical protein
MNEHDAQFENFLREFHPRQPRALPAASAAESICQRRLYAVAVMTVIIGFSLWFLPQGSPSHKDLTAAGNTQVLPDARPAPETLSIFPLTQLALEDPARLDSVLTEASRKVLPSFQGSESTLRVLAKE